jgi:hypothetical protein
MNLRFLCLILSCVIPLSAFAQTKEIDAELTDFAAKLVTSIKEQGKKKVTVLDFTDLQGAPSELGKYVAEQLTVNLVMQKSGFSVLDRANLKSILAEHKLTATGLVDPENAKKLGQFAGVDAIILGILIPKAQGVGMTAKIIATDTAEIVGAARGEFKKEETVQHFLTQPSTPPAPSSVEPKREPTKAAIEKNAITVGDLHVKVESLKVDTSRQDYGYTTLTLLMSNLNERETMGVAFEQDMYSKVLLTSSRDEVFNTTTLSGINATYAGHESYVKDMTDIAPRSSITVVIKGQALWKGKVGNYKPYRLQAATYVGYEKNGSYPGLKTKNIVLDIQ